MPTRRQFLASALGSAALLALRPFGLPLLRLPGAGAHAGLGDLPGPLNPPDANGLRLPDGFSSRIVAVAGQPVGPTQFAWPIYPDGGACFPTANEGWTYVANSEVSNGGGGASAIRFAANGDIVDAYSILSGTHRNCAGGPTPWGTWLSCEEVAGGLVYECDPRAPGQGIARPALGAFYHEAAAVDPLHEHIYLTEDRHTGYLRRFIPFGYPDLSTGTLERLVIGNDGPIQPGETRPIHWVPDDQPATPFARGEGCWYANGRIYFATTADNRVWCIDTTNQTIAILYDAATAANPELTGADNVYATTDGHVYVAEDGGNMQIVAIAPTGELAPLLQVDNHPGSEVAGCALSPDGQRLYFSSQRGPTPGGALGVTFEVSGPFVASPTPPVSRLAIIALPNPARSATLLRLQLPPTRFAIVQIFDARGRRVWQQILPGSHGGVEEFLWQAHDEQLRALPRGVYHIRALTPDASASCKVTMI